MVLVTLLWSMAGIVSRQLQAAQGFEVTFWRSAFNAVALVVLLSLWKGPGALLRQLVAGGPRLWLSGLCWSVMFTAFMMALTLTSVANVLVPMALAPLMAAILARLWLGQRLAGRTAWAIAVAALGLAVMVGPELQVAEPRQALGMLCAVLVPAAGALNWTLIQRHEAAGAAQDRELGMLPAVLIGAVLSALFVVVSAAPFQATGADLAWLGLLGVFQLAVPCLMAVWVARVLPAPEVALLSLLEVVFGLAWAWIGTAEQATVHALIGAAMVLAALAANEAAGWSKT